MPSQNPAFYMTCDWASWHNRDLLVDLMGHSGVDRSIPDHIPSANALLSGDMFEPIAREIPALI